MRTFVVNCFRAGDIPNAFRQLEDAGAKFFNVMMIPYWNANGEQIGIEYAIIYQSEKEIPIEVQT